VRRKKMQRKKRVPIREGSERKSVAGDVGKNERER